MSGGNYADWAGNVTALWRARKANDEPVPPLRTLQRAFARELTAGERGVVVPACSPSCSSG